jgi:ubiquinone/menaquinone biosynthesis C-methylase UbiE
MTDMTEIDSSAKFNRSAYLYTPNISTGFPARFDAMGFNEADLRKKILDVGCGCIGEALRYGDQIFGIDPNLDQMVINGEIVPSEMGVTVRERSVKALAEELPFKDESFDIVYSVKAVGFYPRNINFEMSVREMLRVVKKQTGVICFNWGQEMTPKILNPTLNRLQKEGYNVNIVSNWIYIVHPQFNDEKD